jgi:dTDP-4-dehydrorhamnose reductase
LKTNPKTSNQSNLILGASGFLGDYVTKEFSNWIYHTSTKTETKYGIQKKFENHKDLIELFDNTNISAIINTIALADIELCETNRDEALWLNSELPYLLSIECRKKNIKLIHISTDAIFDGNKSLYDETDIPNPKSYYGKTKFLGEELILGENTESLILRVNFFGNSKKRSLFKFFYLSGQAQTEIKGYTDVFFTSLYAGHLAKLINSLFRRNLKGIYHVVGNQRISKYDFGQLVYREFGFNTEKLKKAMLQNLESGQVGLRSFDLSLSNSKLLKTGVTVPTFEEGLRALRKELDSADKK